jgi:hypothetical protein
MRPKYPSDLNSKTYSVRVPNAVATTFDARLRSLGLLPQHALALAVTCFAELADPKIRASLKPAWVALSRSDPVRERMLANGTFMAVRAQLECPGSGCSPELLASARGDVASTDTPPAPPPDAVRPRLIELLQLAPGASDAEILSAVEDALRAAQGGPPPAPAAEEYSAGLRSDQLAAYRKITDPGAQARFAAACKAQPPAVKRSAPAPAKPGCGGACNGAAKITAPVRAAVTRETLCRHLGINPARAYGGEIRRKAGAIASGRRLMHSSPEAAAALRAHLGLQAHCTDDAVKSIVWSLTTPAGSTIVNPYAARLAREGK